MRFHPLVAPAFPDSPANGSFIRLEGMEYLDALMHLNDAVIVQTTSGPLDLYRPGSHPRCP